MLTLLERLPSLESLSVEKKPVLVLSERTAPLLKNLRHLSILGTYDYDSQEYHTPFINPGFFQSLAQYGAKLEYVILQDCDNVLLPLFDNLNAFPSLRHLNMFRKYVLIERKHNLEKEEQHWFQFFRGFLRRDRNMNNNITTVASTTIEGLTLYDVSQLTYSMLNALGDLDNLRFLYINLSTGYCSLPEAPDSGCLNIDLCGVLQLLLKGKKLRTILFYNVISSGEYLPSYYLNKKLFEQEKADFQLQKYHAVSDSLKWLNEDEILLESTLDIVNLHYS